MTAAGIRIFENTGVTEVKAGQLILEGGKTYEFDECLWCTQASAAGWLASAGLPLDKQVGAIMVDT